MEDLKQGDEKLHKVCLRLTERELDEMYKGLLASVNGECVRYTQGMMHVLIEVEEAIDVIEEKKRKGEGRRLKRIRGE